MTVGLFCMRVEDRVET